MKVVQINSVCGQASTGRICLEISQKLNKENIENYVFYGISKCDYSQAVKFGNELSVKSHILKTRLLGKHAFYSKDATRQLIEKIAAIQPDIIHLHNIHGHYLNIEVLFNYLSKADKPVVWTLHDCWAFTGHCVHFDKIGCEKWKTGCYKCPQLKSYPISLIFDRSKESWQDKKALFTSVKTMVITTPSEWLAHKARQSFLGKYPVRAIYNGVDTALFSPKVTSETKYRHNLGSGFVILAILGPKNEWLAKYIDLSAKIGFADKIVLVGLDNDTIKRLPANIIGINKIPMEELADIYNAADVFVHSSEQDSFGLVIAESLACGTPAIVCNKTACPEVVDNKECGGIITDVTVDTIYNAIEYIKKKGKSFYSENCRRRAVMFYDKNKKYDEFMELYTILCSRAGLK